MRYARVFLAIIIILGLTTGCQQAADPAPGPSQNETKLPEISFKFDNGDEGWKGEFSDIPTQLQDNNYQTEFSYVNIPVAGQESNGLMLKADNKSDYMFMYTYVKLGTSEGIEKNTKYNVDISFDMATNVPKDAGAAADNVFIKSGIVKIEPMVSIENNMKKLNLDKGTLGQDGLDLKTMGTVGKIDTSDSSTYQYKKIESTFDLITDNTGDIWVIIGVESGYLGMTQVYFDNVILKFTKE